MHARNNKINEEKQNRKTQMETRKVWPRKKKRQKPAKQIPSGIWK
jgi:hypothetical protein